MPNENREVVTNDHFEVTIPVIVNFRKIEILSSFNATFPWIIVLESEILSSNFGWLTWKNSDLI